MKTKKSSLKTFLAGENEPSGIKLKDSLLLSDAVADKLEVDGETIQSGLGYYAWYVDVLDDGTAITYCSKGM
jgi:hypothetical protein